jgi:hypothetical protein
MKTTLFLLCFFCASTAFAQNASVIQSRAVPFQIPDNPQHASQHDLATEQSLLPSSAYSYAKGEIPLWELGTLPEPVSLGAFARAYRQEHAAARKSGTTFEKYVAQK